MASRTAAPGAGTKTAARRPAASTNSTAGRTARPAQPRKKVRTRHFFDFSLILLTVALCVFGLIVIYSSSAYTAQYKDLPADYYLKLQARNMIIGFVGMMFLAIFVPYQIFMEITIPKLNIKLHPSIYFYLLMCGVQLYTLFRGVELNGARRWLRLPGLGTFQPSDFSKIAVILLAAYLVCRKPNNLNKLGTFFVSALVMAPLWALIAVENLSASLIVAAIVFVIYFVASKKYWYFPAALGVCGVGLFAIIQVLGTYRLERINIWQNVETHEKGYQILQGMYAIVNGGWFGTGLGQSAQKLGNIPEPFNDMIFTIICEELGVVGAAIMLLIFFLLITRLCFVAMNARDLFGSMVVVGVMAHIAVQVVMNILVVTNTIPSTGVALPFISYGGTAVICLMLEIGICLNVSKQIEYNASSIRKEELEEEEDDEDWEEAEE